MTPQFTTIKIPDNKSKNSNWAGILKKYLYHWPLFLVGFAFSFTCLYFYLKKVVPVYEVKASLLIQDEKKIPNQSAPLREIDQINPAKLIENEIEIFKSKQLIDRVVSDLHLATDYHLIQDGKPKNIYSESPFKLILLNASGNYENAQVQIRTGDATTFYVKMPSGEYRGFKYGTKLHNGFGTWQLMPTNKLGQYHNAEIQVTVNDPDKLALMYQKTIGISLPNKLSTTLVLSVNDDNAQRGKDILNSLILNYNLLASSVKNRQTKNTLDFLDQRIASLVIELNAAEKGIERYKSSQGLTDIAAGSKINLENNQFNDIQLNETNVQLSVIEGIERYLRSNGSSSASLPTSFGIKDERLSNLIEKLTELTLLREKQLATTPEHNPAFEPINRQITSTKAAIADNVVTIKSTLLNTKNKLESIRSNFSSSIRNIPVQERELISIKRQQATKENLYTYLLQKREEMSVSYASGFADERVVDSAYIASAKNGFKTFAIAVALLMAFALPAIFIFIRDLIKNRIATPQEIKENLELNMISELPYEHLSQSGTLPKLANGMISEQLRALRIRMYQLHNYKERGRVTLVTSTISGEGKSFVSSNLAMTLTNAGRKTIVVELDLRRPQLAKIFGINPDRPGISDYLNGHASFEQIVQLSDTQPEVEVIGAGSPAELPSELLETSTLAELIEDLKFKYDDIILDSPPVKLVPDAIILGRIADVTLYVLRQGVTRKSELEFVKELVAQNHFKSVNFVFNGVKNNKYGYGYTYDKNYYGQSKPRSLSSTIHDFVDRF
ncbi:GumC family protein [Dyadobacter luticola]|uniref:Polysaccharide biosynthesis tyrosine autokinase n=1 Tax=Dyadobacter luticola TaxID=1979387 RepID=A0A5R9L486_9BACT|nr:polysaccharide biosynthesis tyrosine autokinase [Dyadobacter luticola]TLV03221.1 polysaccharide biosynthesis tyrosine autokinase [Dyadobacter luticola]